MQKVVQSVQVDITRISPPNLHGYVCFCFSDGSRTGFVCEVPLSDNPQKDQFALEAEGTRQLQRMPEYRSGQTTLVLTSKLMAS